ncbi:MAG: L,D-transpeptidase family protein [Candidatus Riflebacteria bacterium]|nr:L,D-transpeptidase family protein [Candidatus Riflebacteria bacterium]
MRDVRDATSRRSGVLIALLALALVPGPVRAETPPGAPLSGTRLLDRLRLPDAVGQLVLVITPDWWATRGWLTLWERERGAWRRRGRPVDVVVGRSGMGWGRGLHLRATLAGPTKREGDGRSPAGIFDLGPMFGYGQAGPTGGSGFPYRQATRRDFFVDDPGSAEYNTWVRLPEGVAPGDRWRSHEEMRRPDELYELGLVVQHNTDPVEPGAGSAIFVHLWRRPGSTTAGCTAMQREDLRGVLAWLDRARRPLLVQGPPEAVAAMAFRPSARTHLR